MGSIIAVSPFLESLAALGGPSASPATKLMRAQILTANRRGHYVKLSTEFLRRRICHAARYGHIADGYAECSRCGTQAKLADWVAAAEWTEKECRDVWGQHERRVYHEYLAYLLPCPGEQYAADIAASAALPDSGRR